jgi:hypothetical protein
MAAGDPAATAAVEAAFQQRGLRQAALNGNKGAAEILAQQGRDAADIEVANITAKGAERVGLAKARSDAAAAQRADAKDAQAQRNFERTMSNAEGKERRDNAAKTLESRFGKQFDKDGNLTPQYAGVEAAIRNTMLDRVNADGTPMTLATMPEQEREDLLQEYALYTTGNKTGWRAMLDWALGNEVANTNEIRNMAPVLAGPRKPSKGLFGGYNWTTQTGQKQYASDLTLDQQRRLNLIQPGGQ